MKTANSIAISALFVLIILCASCTRGNWDGSKEAPCPLWIVDDEYKGPQHMIMGIGMGGIAALDIALDNPELFGASAALASPTDLGLLLAGIESKLNDFDDWPASPSRLRYLQFLRDIFIALGNPVYVNPLSKFYPPGVTSDEPTIVRDFISPQNTDGAISTITFADESGFFVDFLLALDLNANGLRDAGEPIQLRMHEPFVDANLNGSYDQGEQYDDFGLDGVNGTSDDGEANGEYDVNPRIATWLKHSPVRQIQSGDINTDSRFKGAMYLDCGVSDFWGCSNHVASMVNAIDTAYEAAPTPSLFHCLEFGTGIYNGFFSNYPYPTEPIWFTQKNAALYWESESDPADNHLGSESTQVARWSHVLSFLSERLPNGYFGDSPNDSTVYYETHSFTSPTLGEDVEMDYSILLPAGYYNTRNRWKTYPVLIVLLDQDQKVDDLMDLIETQASLAADGFAQQVLMVLLEGDRDQGHGEGYHFFLDQESDEYSGDYRDMIISDLIEHMETRYRAKIRSINSD